MDRWQAGEERDDRRAGEVVAMLYNVNRDTKKDRSGKGWRDFFPEHDTRKQAPKRVQTDEEMFAAMSMWAAAVNRSTPRA